MSRILNLIRLSDYPDLVQLHLDKVAGTIELENYAQELMSAGLPQTMLEQFIRKVHSWGGSHRNLPKVLSYDYRDCFMEAVTALNSEHPEIEKAFRYINLINGLGVSYGSKHLRFLRPDICPVLDNNIWKEFKYHWNEKGYKNLCDDVMEIAKSLVKNGIRNPVQRAGGKWFAADIDMAVFAYLQHRAKKSGWL